MAPFLSCLVGILLLFQQAWFPVGYANACETMTETRVALAGTTVSDHEAFKQSLDGVYSTPKVTATVVIWSSLETYPGGSFTAYGIYDLNVLTSAGFSSFTTDTAVVTHCPEPAPATTATGSGTVPPSPVGSSCTLDSDGDHWDCAAPSTGETGGHAEPTSATCSPHVDHWHCPPGIVAPSTPPSPADLAGETSAHASTTDTAAAATCSPHIDHWHCPPGVVAPPTPPSPDDLAGASSAHASAAKCSPHVDHWHCPPGVVAPTTPPGPSDFAAATATTTGATSAPPTGGAAHVVANHFFQCALLVWYLL
ncbi:hypothetical protein SLS62_008449 [Diatrype stigma]|uniref:Uncharacterized protein n=1 Tax=Diatrype stigma TaxID=117547 RepID=A0AAN9UT49_9PEZI